MDEEQVETSPITVLHNIQHLILGSNSTVYSVQGFHAEQAKTYVHNKEAVTPNMLYLGSTLTGLHAGGVPASVRPFQRQQDGVPVQKGKGLVAPGGEWAQLGT